MCGIAATFAYRPGAGSVDRAELAAIRDAMHLRGPDGAGDWYSEDGRVGLTHRRLSIIDLSARGNQPMRTPDGRLHITFNGEIYNYKQLRAGLERDGAEFFSDSDTEVVLRLFERRGTGMFEALRGMYAFALWDARVGGLLLARDPYGIKPLYLADDGGAARIASQVKALLAGGRVPRGVDCAAKVGFFLFGSVPEPRTIREAVRAVPAGSYQWIRDDGPEEPVRFTSIAREFAEAERRDASVDEREVFECARAALTDSVAHHMVADVPVGAFLSAGVDSGATIGLVRDAGIEDVQTVTLAFEEYRNRHEDEAPFAERTAAYYGTRHVTRLLGRDEFTRELPRIFAAMDQPSIDGVNTYLVSKVAAERGLKVALSGLGGDELFGGYNTFDDVPAWVRRFALPRPLEFVGPWFRRAYRLAPWNAAHPKRAGLFEFGGDYPGAYFLRRGLYMPWELDAVMPRDEARAGLELLAPVRAIGDALDPVPSSAYGRIATLEASWYMRNQLLRDTDWAGMAHSLELRVPLVDASLLHALAPTLVRCAMRYRKRLLSEAPLRPLPREILERRKTGFQVPVHAWLETSPGLDAWRRVPALAHPRCPWARRWAYTVMATEYPPG